VLFTQSNSARNNIQQHHKFSTNKGGGGGGGGQQKYNHTQMIKQAATQNHLDTSKANNTKPTNITPITKDAARQNQRKCAHPQSSKHKLHPNGNAS